MACFNAQCAIIDAQREVYPMDKHRLKTILRWLGGIFLVLLAATLLLSFIFTALARDVYGSRLVAIPAQGVAIWWAVILLLGAPGAMLLRKAILALKRPRRNESEGTVTQGSKEDSEDKE